MSDTKPKKTLSMKTTAAPAAEVVPPPLAIAQPAEKEQLEKRPKNRSRGDDFPVVGFALAVDGKFKSNYATSAGALKVGLELKQKFPVLQVVVYDAVEKTRMIVELPAAAAV